MSALAGKHERAAQRRSSNRATTTRVAPAPAPNPLVDLQRLVGNRAVQRQMGAGALPPKLIAGQLATLGNHAAQRLLSRYRLQAKLTMTAPRDAYEQEADRVADTIMNMPAHAGATLGGHVQQVPTISRLLQTKRSIGPVESDDAPIVDSRIIQRAVADRNQSATPTDEIALAALERPVAHAEAGEAIGIPLQRAASSELSEVSRALESQVIALQGSGRPLPAADRAFFEPRFGADFSTVRLHTDTQAAQTARAINARAYTVGSNIVFGEGEYQPGGRDGQHLLAHELTHTLQQGAVKSKPAHGNDAEGEARSSVGTGPRSKDGRGGVTSTPTLDTFQRRIGDGHDLTSPRFAGDPVLEGVFDNERLLTVGSSGPAVIKVQQALVDLGHVLPKFGVDGQFGSETKQAVKDFQAASGLSGKAVDGIVGPITMGLLDTRAGGGGPTPPTPPGPTPPGPTPPGPTPPGPTPPGPTPPGPIPPGPTPPGPTPPAPPVTVTLPQHIRGTASPASMNDRIPPSVSTPVAVTVSGLAPGGPPVQLSITGASGSNGTVTIDGGATANVSASGTVQLRGGTQTGRGNAGNLRLVASLGGTALASSTGFSVSSIPQNYSDTFLRMASADDASRRGIVVQDRWESDSGTVPDLNQTELREQVEPIVGNGCFDLGASNTSGFLPGDTFSEDTHSTAASVMTSAGTRIVTQTSEFNDHRSNSLNIPMTDSGYTITRVVIAKPGGGFQLTTTKVGAAVTANGVTSGAGSGSISRTEDV